MLRQLDKSAVKQLLRNPDNKVFRNQMMNIGWWVAILTLVSAWLILVLSDIDVLKTVLVILIVNGGWCVPYVLAFRRYAIALTKEGMYISHVSTEDFRGPLSRRNLFVRWDEFTQLKLTQGPIMTPIAAISTTFRKGKAAHGNTSLPRQATPSMSMLMPQIGKALNALNNASRLSTNS